MGARHHARSHRHRRQTKHDRDHLREKRLRWHPQRHLPASNPPSQTQSSDFRQRLRANARSNALPRTWSSICGSRPSGTPCKDCMDVRIDNWTGGFEIGSHLISLGHRQFAAITGPMSTTCYPARLAGFRAALAQHDIVLNDTQVREGDYWSENARLHALDLLQQKNRPTAVFACSDTQAFGIYDAAHQLGLSIPEDLSVTGFDDINSARHLGPPLTTIAAATGGNDPSNTCHITIQTSVRRCSAHAIVSTNACRARKHRTSARNQGIKQNWRIKKNAGLPGCTQAASREADIELRLCLNSAAIFIRMAPAGRTGPQDCSLSSLA